MLTIRHEQMQALQEAMRRQFGARLLEHLRVKFPGNVQDLSDEEMRDLIRKGIGDSSKYGVINEADVVRYVEFMLILGPEFDSNPKSAWAGEILQTQGMTGTQKMEKIDACWFVLNRRGGSRLVS